MSLSKLGLIYRLFRHRTGQIVPIMEERLGADAVGPVSMDDERNEPNYIIQLFSEEKETKSFNQLFNEFVTRIRGISFEQSDAYIEGLNFLQGVIVNAIMKRLSVGKQLKSFARQFDRLDVPAERLRLYQMIQKGEI
jgi:hypothetical protein